MAGTSISLPTQMEAEIEKIAFDERKTKSGVVQEALALFLEQKKTETKQRRRRI